MCVCVWSYLRRTVSQRSEVRNLADGAHSPHVALVARAVLRRGEKSFRIQTLHTSVDGNFADSPQIAVTPDLQLRRVLCRNTAERRGENTPSETSNDWAKSHSSVPSSLRKRSPSAWNLYSGIYRGVFVVSTGQH